MIFRAYGEGEDRISMMRWVTGITGLLTLGLIVSVALVATRMTSTDLVVAIALMIVDVIGIYLLIDDTQRIAGVSNLVEET